MKKYNKLMLSEIRDKIDESYSIVKLINADENNENYIETLTSVSDYLYLAVAGLNSVVE